MIVILFIHMTIAAKCHVQDAKTLKCGPKKKKEVMGILSKTGRQDVRMQPENRQRRKKKKRALEINKRGKISQRSEETCESITQRS